MKIENKTDEEFRSKGKGISDVLESLEVVIPPRGTVDITASQMQLLRLNKQFIKAVAEGKVVMSPV